MDSDPTGSLLQADGFRTYPGYCSFFSLVALILEQYIRKRVTILFFSGAVMSEISFYVRSRRRPGICCLLVPSRVNYCSSFHWMLQLSLALW